MHAAAAQVPGGTVIHRKTWRRSALRWIAPLLALVLIASACGGGDDDDSSSGGGGGGGRANPPTRARPSPGGEITYGLEAETASGWCLPEAQLAISGIQVARAIYDTLTAPDENGEIKPFLAESVERQRRLHGVDDQAPRRRHVPRRHRARRDGREEQPRRVPRRRIRPASRCCSSFTFQDIASVDVVDPLTVNGHDEAAVGRRSRGSCGAAPASA